MTSASDYIESPPNSENLIYNSNGVRIIVVSAVTTHDYYGGAIYLYIENTTGTGLMFSVANSKLNGVEAHPVFNCYVPQSSVVYECVGFMPYDFTAASITNTEHSPASTATAEPNGDLITADITIIAVNSQTGETLFTVDASIIFD